MKVYLDTCCLHRPLDDRSQLRIRLEAEAVLGILMAVETGHVQLMSSEVLVFEVRMNPHPQKRAFVSAIIEAVHRRRGLTNRLRLGRFRCRMMGSKHTMHFTWRVRKRDQRTISVVAMIGCSRKQEPGQTSG
jgi:hypothetical protein